MELLPLLFLSFCFLTLSGLTFGAESGTPVTRVLVKEDDDVILPCSLGTKENIESMTFDWKKEGTVPRKEVFMYLDRNHYNNGLPGQNEEFKGRVSHFPEGLKYGNASIRINKTRRADKGNYTCIFPGKKTFHIELVVEDILKDRTNESIAGIVPDPIVKRLDGNGLLQCEVKGALPEPTVEWWDSNNQTLHSEKSNVTRNGYFYITLKTAVTKTGLYRCVATQKELQHQISTETFVQRFPLELVISLSVGFFLLLVSSLVAVLCVCYKNGNLNGKKFICIAGTES